MDENNDANQNEDFEENQGFNKNPGFKKGPGFKKMPVFKRNENPKKNEGFTSFSEIFQAKQQKKAPAYPWQEFALRIIGDLGVPGFKRSAVFKVCRDLPTSLVERALNDTKELCQSGARWKYFFKIVDGFGKNEGFGKKEGIEKKKSSEIAEDKPVANNDK